MPGGTEPTRPESRRTSKPSLPFAIGSANAATADTWPQLPATEPAIQPMPNTLPAAELPRTTSALDDSRASRGARKASREHHEEGQAPPVLQSHDSSGKAASAPAQEQRSSDLPGASGKQKKTRSRHESSDKRSKKDSVPVEPEPTVVTPPEKEPSPSLMPAVPVAAEIQHESTALLAPTRPMTAKKAPPKAASNPETSRRAGIRRPGGSRTIGEEVDGMQTEAPSHVRVFHEGAQDGDDDEVQILQDADQTMAQPGRAQDTQHGSLVTDMIQAQQRAEKELQIDALDESMQDGIRIERKKKEQAPRTDMLQLREAIESLCQNINPLARSMEYLQVRQEFMLEMGSVFRASC